MKFQASSFGGRLKCDGVCDMLQKRHVKPNEKIFGEGRPADSGNFLRVGAKNFGKAIFRSAVATLGEIEGRSREKIEKRPSRPREDLNGRLQPALRLRQLHGRFGEVRRLNVVSGLGERFGKQGQAFGDAVHFVR